MAIKRTYTASKTLDPVPEIPKRTMNHIYYVADSMIGKAGLVEADRCDLIQDLSLAAWHALSIHQDKDGKASLSTYLSKAVDLTAKCIYRDRIRKHYDIPFVSLDELLQEEECGRSSAIESAYDEAEKQDRCMDIRLTVESLPEDLRIICRLIMYGYTLKEISVYTGIPEATIRLIRLEQIRTFFIACGISADFLKR